MAKLIIGCGYLGLRVARQWLADGEEVFAVTRSALRGKDLEAEGIVPVVADVTAPATLSDLLAVDSVLYAVGFDRSAGKDMREVYVSGLKHVLDSLSDSVEKLVYVSSTGVYGQQAGETVDEHSPTEPDREGGRICLEAEQALREHRLGEKAIILRMAGIYGPDRIPRVDDVKAGKPITSPPDGTMNLIHVDDAAEICVQAAAEIAPPELFCVADGQPVRRRDYYGFLAELLSAPPPQFEAPAADAHVSQRALSSKQIDSRKLRAALGRPLKYPSYREGLASIV